MQSFSEEKETVRETEHNTNTLHHLFIGCVGDRAFKDNDDDDHDDDEDNDDDNELPMRTVHANERIKVPSGRQAEQIKEFIDIAHQTGQTSKIMNFPPIDHESAIS